MTRGRAERRRLRRRVIRHRLRIIHEAWTDCEWPEHSGRLAKYNLACGCWMCSHRWTRWETRAKRQKERRRLKEVRNVISAMRAATWLLQEDGLDS